MVCKYCSKDHDESMFEVANIIHGKVYRRLKCRFCKQQAQNNRRAKIKNWFDDFKKTLKCQKCGNTDFRVMEFHHTDSATKDGDVATLIATGHSISTVMKEIQKCVVLCANCHRILHWNEKKHLIS